MIDLLSNSVPIDHANVPERIMNTWEAIHEWWLGTTIECISGMDCGASYHRDNDKVWCKRPSGFWFLMDKDAQEVLDLLPKAYPDHIQWRIVPGP
jgi:hypothetical protein